MRRGQFVFSSSSFALIRRDFGKWTEIYLGLASSGPGLIESIHYVVDPSRNEHGRKVGENISGVSTTTD